MDLGGGVVVRCKFVRAASHLGGGVLKEVECSGGGGKSG